VARITLRQLMKSPPAVRDSVLKQLRKKGPLATDEKPVRFDPFDSNLERDFASYLTALGHQFIYHPVKLKIATGRQDAWYTPDFRVRAKVALMYTPGEDPTIDATQTILYEVKGYWRTADRLRVKVAAGLYPEYIFVGVTRVKGEWRYENF
jgi:hypothetical protein